MRQIKFRRHYAVGILAAALVSFYGNCSNVRLMKIEPPVKTTSLSDPYYLTPPSLDEAHHRYIFVVDMSNSMIAGHCNRDVDGENPYDQGGAPCAISSSVPIGSSRPNPYLTSEGTDPNADRITIVDRWLTAILGGLTPAALAKTKIVVAPFSGGQKDIERKNREGALGFKDIVTAKNYLNVLRSEQTEDLNRQQSATPQNPLKMGTSVPGKKIQEVFELLRADMDDLQRRGELHSARYEIVYLGDGVPRPRKGDIQAALAGYPGGGCSVTCTASTCSKDCMEVQDGIKRFWGDYEDNEIANFIYRLRMLKGLNNLYGEADLNISLVQMHEARIPVSDLRPDTNLLLAARDALPQLKFYKANSSTPPFDIYGTKRDLISYKLTTFFTLNPNYRVRSATEMGIDSDGDGLFDADEGPLGYDPKKSRTSRNCLDSIANQPAFKDKCATYVTGVDCEADLDQDGDGLNDCEEKIVGTSSFDFDSDNDTIPDSLEIIYGYKINEDDAMADSNSDNFTNLVNFSAGLGPFLGFAATPNEKKIQMQKNFVGFRVSPQGNGGQLSVESYDVKVVNMPISGTSTVANARDILRYSRPPSMTVIPPENQLLMNLEAGNSNHLLFLVRAIDVDEPEKAYWWVLQKDVVVASSVASNVSIGLDNMTFMKWVIDRRDHVGGTD